MKDMETLNPVLKTAIKSMPKEQVRDFAGFIFIFYAFVDVVKCYITR